MNTESVQQSKMEKEQRTRLEQCKRLNTCARKGQIVFAGSSLMEFFPVNELQQSPGINVCVYNRGVSGYISEQLLAHMQDLILDLEPSKLFINIGTNDIGRGIADQLWSNYQSSASKRQRSHPRRPAVVTRF